MGAQLAAVSIVVLVGPLPGATAWTAVPPDVPPVSDPGRADAPYPVTTLEDPEIRESSGLGVSGRTGLMFTMGDAGDDPTVYAVGPTGETRYRVSLPEGSNTDWEDLAVVSDPAGGAWIYVADTGDAYLENVAAAKSARREFRLFRFREPPPSTTGTVAATELTTWDLAYDDDRGHNAEGLLVAPDQTVYLVEKTRDEKKGAGLWTVPGGLATGTTNLLTKVAQVPITRVTGAAWSPYGDMVAIRDHDTAYLWSVSDSLPVDLARPAVPVALPRQRQGEAVTFDTDGRTLLLSSEGRRTPIWSVPFPRVLTAAPATGTAVEPGTAAADRRSALAAAVAVGVGVATAVVLVVRRVVRRAGGAPTKSLRPRAHRLPQSAETAPGGVHH